MANASQNLDPWAVTKSVDGSLIGDTALDARYDIGALGQPDPSAAFAWTDGVFPSAQSGTTILDYQVSAATPSPNMTARVQFGNAQIGRLNQGPYTGASTASQNVTFTTSNPSNPRVDYVVIRTADPGVDASPTQSWFMVVLPGTPAAVPVEPTGSLTDGDLLIAAVTIRANTTQVLTADISDRRVFVTARGGVYPKSAVDTRNGAYPGMCRYNLATAAFEGWSGTAWVPWGGIGGWTTFTPQLFTGGSPAGVGGGTTLCNLGSGSVATGRYQIVGKRLDLRLEFQWGTGPYNMGTGPVNSYLPAGLSAAPQAQRCYSMLSTNTAVYGIAAWCGEAAVRASSNVLLLSFPRAAGDCRVSFWNVATSPGAPGTGTPLIPGEFPEGGYLWVNGTFEIA